MFERFRRFLNPISPPKIIKVPCSDLKPEFADFTPTTNINFPLLVHPSISNNLCRISTLLNPTPLFAPIPHPNIKLLFEPLPRPQIIPIPLTLPAPHLHYVPVYIERRGERGKVYETVHTDKAKPTQTQKYVFCKHGTLLYRCPECSTTRPSSAPTKIVDEFDLLPPYLYPPYEDMLKTSSMWLKNIKPFDYQIQGIDFLVKHPAALLGDEMGLGKTVQAIIALWATFRRNEVSKGLIVCRRTLLSNWEEELKRWSPIFLCQRVHGVNKLEREQMWRSPASLYLTTYDTLREDIDQIQGLKTKFQQGVIILDEVQDIKNPSTRRHQAIRQIQAKYRWGLSGTPVENKAEDVVAIFNYLKPDLFYRQPATHPEEIKQRIAPHFLRRRAKNVLTLPPKEVRPVWLELTPQQRKAYDQTYQESYTALKQAKATRVHAIAYIGELVRICNYEEKHRTSVKLDYILDELEIIVANKHKALIFSQFPTKTLEVIMPRLQAFDPAIYQGSLTDKQREQVIDRFQNQDSPKVLLVSTKAGGVGLNLQRANYVFHFDHLWNPAAQHQATGRAYRYGQEQTVFVYDIFTKNTIEERIQQVLHQKQALFDAIIDDLSAEYQKGKFTEAELFALFDLTPPRK